MWHVWKVPWILLCSCIRNIMLTTCAGALLQYWTTADFKELGSFKLASCFHINVRCILECQRQHTTFAIILSDISNFKSGLLNGNALTLLQFIRRMIKIKWVTVVLSPCYKWYLRSRNTALLPIWFRSSRTLFPCFNMGFNHASLVCLNSFKLSMKLVKL